MDHMSRRALFAGVLAAVAGVVARAVPAAAGASPVLIGETNVASEGETTRIVSYSSGESGALAVEGGEVGIDALGSIAITAWSEFGDVPGSGLGIFAGSADGRGGAFRGNVAQVRLIPSPRPTHPVSGLRGDLFMDRRDRLWLCRGQNDWVRVA